MAPINIKLTVSYEGTNYQGFQSQKNSRSVEEQLLAAIGTITKNRATIYAAGRTDTGVHAEGQVINFFADKPGMNENNWFFALNGLLPKDIRIIECEFVPDDFNARKNCMAREYWYHIFNSNGISALQNRYMTIYPNHLDERLLQSYCNELVGCHDFTSFSSSVDESRSKIRNIYLARTERTGDTVIIKLIGNAFLHHMVRTIAGTFIMLNKKNSPPSEMTKIIESRDRGLAGLNYFAKGLVFKRAFYDLAELKTACPDYTGKFFIKNNGCVKSAGMTWRQK